jgi:hypothetical protein
MMSRDEELLAKHIVEALPGLLGGNLSMELHRVLREERARWLAEMKGQQANHREAVKTARAEGYAEAKEQAAMVAQDHSAIMPCPVASAIRAMEPKR